MARETFIDSLRRASRSLSPSTVHSGMGLRSDVHFRSVFDSADLWLTRKSVDGFEAADYEDWPERERARLAEEVSKFLVIAKEVPADRPATKRQSELARRHLEGAIRIVRQHLLPEWIEAQKDMMKEATAAARSEGWYVEQDEKEVREGLLGSYQAPRLRIRSPDREVVLDPIAYFGSGRQGVVDLVVMPAYETEYLITFKNGRWRIVSPRGTLNSRPFTRDTFLNTITRLPLH